MSHKRDIQPFGELVQPAIKLRPYRIWRVRSQGGYNACVITPARDELLRVSEALLELTTLRRGNVKKSLREDAAHAQIVYPAATSSS